eukprot:TRINITY_DN58900_c0_g1_i1.p1 TRINITY_DN58900_c0_g1~~TRINITY_DN58900_c0_g1_i1.p1  ORF type:complete len:121 (+),score=45.17 TRINITY_DN58900_c0_g1_i1:121-483(+)
MCIRDRDNAMWRYCGAGLPEQEAFLLDQSIAKLAREKSLSEVRFVGKIFGLVADYVVVSSKRFVDEAAGEVIYKEAVSYTHLRAHETPEHLVCRLLLEKKKKKKHTVLLDMLNEIKIIQV